VEPLTGYAAVLIVFGEVLAVVGVLIVLYFLIRQRLSERVESAKKPERRGLPYPELSYWYVLRERSSLGRRIKRLFLRQKSEGI